VVTKDALPFAQNVRVGKPYGTHLRRPIRSVSSGGAFKPDWIDKLKRSFRYLPPIEAEHDEVRCSRFQKDRSTGLRRSAVTWLNSFAHRSAASSSGAGSRRAEEVLADGIDAILGLIAGNGRFPLSRPRGGAVGRTTT